MRRFQAVLVGVVAIVAILVIVAWGAHNAVARDIVSSIARSYGYQVSFARFNVTLSHADLGGISVTSAAGEPVLSARSVVLRYSLSDMLRGKRRFGLEYVDVDHPQLTLIHHADGTYNVKPIQMPRGPQKAQPPLWMRLRLQNGSVAMIDQYSASPHVRRADVVGVNVNADLAPNRRSFYNAHLAIALGGRTYPVHGYATFDEAAGFESQHWSAQRVPIAQLLDFALPTRQIDVASGEARDVDFRMFSLADKNGVFHAHLGGHADLDDLSLFAIGLQTPLRDVHGTMLLTDDALSVPRLDARLAGIPIEAAGGVFDFTAPTVWFGARGTAPLQQLRTIAKAAANRPVSGPLAFHMLALGAATRPVVFAAFSSPQIRYGKLTIARARGLVAVQGAQMDVIDSSLQYGPLTVDARGSMLLDKQLNTTIVARVSGPSDRLPYVAQMVPHMPLRGVAVVTGVDRAIRFDGVIDGASKTQRLAGIASVNADGTGTAGPITIDGPGDERLYARVALDRPANENGVFLSAHRFAIHPGVTHALPGLPSRPLPKIDGVLNTHAVALQHGSGLDFLAGDADVSRAHLNGIAIGKVLALGSYVHGSGRLGAILAGTRIAGAPVDGHMEVAYDARSDRMQLLHSAVSLGGGVGIASGTVSGIRTGRLRYDVDAQMLAADLAVLTRTFGVHLPYPQGSIDASARVHGAGTNPVIAGNVTIPEASINGLAFSGSTAFGGNAAGVTTHGGKLVVGSTQLDFTADVGTSHKTLSIASNAVNLADFNDYFDTAETLAGRGSLALNVDATNGLTTNGRVALSGIRFRRFTLGNGNADWSTFGREITLAGSVVGSGGSLNLRGSAQVGDGGSFAAMAQHTSLNATARMRGFDLATWLPAAGINAPLLGHIDADATARGALPTIAVSANAALYGGMINQVPVQRFTIVASAAGGRGRIDSATLDIPYLTASASGTFGLHPQAPVDLTMHASSTDVGSLASTVTHKKVVYHGALDTTLHATGVLSHPALDSTIDLANFTYNGFAIPHAHTEVVANNGMVDVRNGSVAFVHGSAAFSAHVPFVSPSLSLLSSASSTDPAFPISGRVDARRIDLAQFAPLFPKGTKLAGILAGTVTLAGTSSAPRFGGALGLSNASFSSPMETNPLTQGSATLAFNGTRATLSRARFTVGKGALEAHGTFDVPNLRDPLHASSANIALAATRAVFNLPKYFSGQLDGTLSAVMRPGTTPAIDGTVAVSHTRIPAAAIIAQALAKPGSGKPPPLAMNMHVAIGPDVRVQGAGVDVGAAGTIAMTGTLANPAINGTISSTGGTINMYRDFTIEHGVVDFTGKLIPNVNATATTFLPQPPTDVRLHVSGPATHMNLALSSNPPYDQGQIIALMIGGPSLAGINGVETAQGPQPPGFLQGIGQGYVNGLVTRNLLEPLQANLGTALGLQNVQFNYDIAGRGGFSAQVHKGIGNNMSLFFASTYGFPSRTTFGADERINNDSSVRFSIFSTYGEEGFGYYPAYLAAQPGSNISLQAQQPLAGQQGFSLNYVRHFK